MFTIRDSVVAIDAVIIGAATLADVPHHAGGQGIPARAAIEAAADRLTEKQIADAWAQTKLGDTTGLDDLVRGVPERYRAPHQDGDAILLSFASQTGAASTSSADPGPTPSGRATRIEPGPYGEATFRTK